MKLKEYATKINALAKVYPDAELVYAIDDEGNAFFPVQFEPVEGQYEDEEFYPANNDFFAKGKEVTHVCIN